MEPNNGAPKSEATKYIVGIIIIALVIVGVSLAGRNKTPQSEQEEYGSPAGEQEPAEKETTAMPKGTVVEVDYTDTNGFTPDQVRIKAGETVKFVNKSSGKMWIASNVHPAHMNYDGTSLREHCATGATPSFDQCADGKEYSFTFTKAGSFDYHNHLRPRMGGTIIVK